MCFLLMVLAALSMQFAKEAFAGAKFPQILIQVVLFLKYDPLSSGGTDDNVMLSSASDPLPFPDL